MAIARSKAELEQALRVYSAERRVYKRELEQYPTPTSIVAHMTWLGVLKGDIIGKTTADYGCGDGRIAIASLVAGASRAVCVELDEDMVRIGAQLAHEHYPLLYPRILFIVGDATRIELRNTDTVTMNPPFGVVRRNRGIDMKFLASALWSSRKVYSVHKYSEGFLRVLEKLAKTIGFNLEYLELIDFNIPMLYAKHRRRTHRFKAVLVILAKGECLIELCASR
ncbi:MAG: DNA methylase [Desulfurococcaceae archaeon]|nr:DNA methylase [Desulfurococcaceae archaeon]